MANIKNNIAYLVLCMLLGFVVLVRSGGVQAQTQDAINAAARQAEILQRQEQDLLRQDQDRAKKSLPGVGGADLRRPDEAITPRDIGGCRHIDELVIEGGDSLRTRTVEQLAKSYTGRCLGVADIEQVLGLITKDYFERGFITTRAYLPGQDLAGGRLRIVVVEGEIEAYRLEGEGASRIFLPGVFPGSPGDKLNLRDLEQGIDQINRLASNKATMEISPGSKPGKSVVVIRNARTFPVHLYLGHDNLGSESTGKEARTFTVTLDAPLGLNERWMLTQRRSHPHDREHNSRSTSLDLWIPLGKSSLGLNTSQSSYENVLTLPSGIGLHTNGETVGHALTVDRLLHRDQARKLSMYAKLSMSDSRNYILGQLMEVSSRRLSQLDIGMNGFLLVAGGVLTSQVAYSRGLRLFDSLEDQPGMSDDAPRAQFSKLNLDLGFSRAFSVAGWPLNWSSQFSYQYAETPLYGSQQIQIGSNSTVRGFTLNSLSGDRGYYWRNELAVPWQFALGGETVAGRVYAAYDVGSVRGLARGASRGSLAGSTIGLAVQWRGAGWDVYSSRPVDFPETMQKESAQTWFRVSYAF
jgi:hemolysin activation/secretion protein